MTTADMLLRAILESPEDDAPRLVYADWLEEHGDAKRAEFIRAQCTLAGMPDGHPTRPALGDRVRQLEAKHRRSWLAPVRRWLDDWWFHRGFVEYISIDTRRFVKRAEDLFCYAPVQRVEFNHADGRVRELAAVPQLRRLTHVYLNRRNRDDYGNDLSDADVWALAAAPLDRVTYLSFGGGCASEEAFRALAASPHLAGLRHLRVIVHTDVPWSALNAPRPDSRTADLGPKLATWFAPGVAEVVEDVNPC